MPTETFRNLSEEKRKRVLDAALDEFAQYTFRQATVSRIVEKAEIPKGSFYQYFEDKEDLYRHLVKEAQKKKMAYMREVLEDYRKRCVFTRLHKVYSSGFRFAKENPRLQAVGQNLLKEDEGFRRQVLDSNLPEAKDFLLELLKEGVESGEINPKADLPVAADLIVLFNMSLINTFLDSPIEEAKQESLKKIDQMIYILRSGLERR